MVSRILCLIVYTLFINLEVQAQEEVRLHVIDVGAGLCTITEMPGPYYMIYDTGNWRDSGESCFEATKRIIPPGSDIDLLVLSHSDADHLGGTDEILDAYKVKKILRTGLRRTTNAWEDADSAIKKEKEYDGATVVDLSYYEFPPGGTYRFGDSWITFLSGFTIPPNDWSLKSQSERRNAGSIVVRLVYSGKSILFTGDAVGLHLNSSDNDLLATEKYLVDNSEVLTIDSDVLIASHHGSKGGSAKEFIQAVSPEYVIFPAGHDHGHPTRQAAQRFLAAGVLVDNIFRTDLGDHEVNKKDEWDYGRIENNTDGTEDDDILIILPQVGEISVSQGDY